MHIDKPVNLITCRETFETALASETRCPPPSEDTGCVVMHAELPEVAYIFERQRIVGAQGVPLKATKPLSTELARQILGPILEQDTLWTTHVWAADTQLTSRGLGIEKALMAQCKKLDTGSWKCWRKPEKLAQRNTGLVLQIFLSVGKLWYGVAEVSEMLNPYPGGIRRMKFDADAPSRSYLKMEEALSYMGDEPQPGQRVIDLGAAPGGWSWSFLKRGCMVTAVDNGPMKIENPGAHGGRLVHVRGDGLSYTPAGPVDWMVSDMLIPPGQVIGLLRRWMDEGWAKRVIFNVKLPQREVYAGLRPLKHFLEEHSPCRIQLKQLYHDRREVTGFGILKD